MQGLDARGAKYTLLGFVEHMGTMRSGHYVAYVQRGMQISQSPHVQALLQKHGLADAPPSSSQASSQTAAAPDRKKQQKALSRKAAVAAGDANMKAAASLKIDKDVVSSSGTGSVALPAIEGACGGSTAHGLSSVRMNGKSQPQQAVPDDWESSDTRTADEPQADVPFGSAMADRDGSPAPPSTKLAAPSTDSAVVDQPASSACKAADSALMTTDSQQAVASSCKSSQTASAAVEDKQTADDKQTVPRAWYYVSDTQVKMVSEADILMREAYILIYMRTG